MSTHIMIVKGPYEDYTYLFGSMEDARKAAEEERRNADADGPTSIIIATVVETWKNEAFRPLKGGYNGGNEGFSR
jgi:hypothetical protein